MAPMSHITETELQDAVIELAQTLGYLIHHDRPARDKDGNWSTHIQGDAGFPDLVLAHPTTHTVIFAELKSTKGKPSPDQQVWLDALPNELCRDCNGHGTLSVMSPGPDLTETEYECRCDPITFPGSINTYLWNPTHWGAGGGIIAHVLQRGAGRNPDYPEPDPREATP